MLSYKSGQDLDARGPKDRRSMLELVRQHVIPAQAALQKKCYNKLGYVIFYDGHINETAEKTRALFFIKREENER